MDSIGKSVSSVSIFNNNICRQNTPPAKPENLRYSFSGESIILEWDKSSDDSTPTKAITYNVRIGSAPGANDILSACSLDDGRLLIPKTGNAEANNY